MWPLPYGLRFLFAYIPLLRPSLTDSPLGQTVPGTCAWFTPHTWPQHTHTLVISKLPSGQFSSVAHVWLFATPWTAARQAFLSITYSQSLLTDAHWVGDAMQLSHPLLSPFPPAFNISWHQGLLQWISSSHQVAKVLECQLQHQSFQWIFQEMFPWYL